MNRLLPPVACLAVLLLSGLAGASTLFRSDPWEYYTNYADYTQGCTVVKHSPLHTTVDPRALTGWEENGEKHPKWSYIFAEVNQRETFVVDLGQLRTVGKIVVTTGLNDAPRIPKEVNIQSSTEGPDGPWKTLVEKGDPNCKFTYLIPNTPARWLRFDLGENTDGFGSRVGRQFGVYKGYKLPEVAELMRAFYPKFRRDCSGLEDFWKKVDTQDWQGAASALRTYEERLYEKQKGMPPHYRKNADMGLENKIDFGNGIIIQFCQGIDWQYHPDNSLNDTERGWFHAHLARAYSITDDVRYAKKLAESLESWMEQLPRPPDTQSAAYDQWATLSVSARTGHWTQVMGLIVKDRENFPDKLFLNLLYTYWEENDFLSNAGQENGNWLASISRAMLGAGLGWTEFADHKNWLDFAREHFVQNVMRDVYPDGKEFENSDGYVPFAYGMLLGMYRQFKDAGIEVPREVERRIKLGSDWSVWTMQPNGLTYMIGDSNGGHTFGPGTGREFDRQDLVYMTTQGKKGSKPSSSSRHFPISGWFIMRSDWEERPWERARHLMMTAAPYGPHGHQDQLSISCYAYGNTLLGVPSRLGDSNYGMPSHWETLHTWSKNTVVVDEKTQGFGYEPGLDRKCKNVEWFDGDYVDVADATHVLYPDVSHRRRVLFVAGEYWVVIDDLTPKPDADADKAHIYDQHFHFQDGSHAVAMKNGAVRTEYKTGGNLMLVPLEPEKLAASEKTSTPVNYIGMQAPTMYGWKYRLRGNGVQRFVTVLYPYPDRNVPKVSVRRLAAPAGVAAIEVRTPAGRDLIYAGDGITDFSYSGSINARARAFAVRLGVSGKPLKAVGLDVERMKAGGYSYAAQGGAKKAVEVDLSSR
ncbi:MAG: heparinase II/III family protein [Armatimonadota bacterium]|nr:heparinase II/III family protein [Armatimonadota bacterium]